MKAALMFAGLALLANLEARAQPEKLVGGPCEGCEAVFQGRPATLTSRTSLIAAGEPGEKMLVQGIVRDAAGKAVPGIIVYAYQTNAAGVYPLNDLGGGAAARRHGILRGWAITGNDGGYRFDTVRPASYPNTDIPQHIHMHIVEPGRCTYYIDDVLFEDDPKLTPQKRKVEVHGRGGNGVVQPQRTADKGWKATRDIVLGRGIADYANCGKQ
jgi:protocatechuate 3,4-dioxygenase, beta subunit